MKDEKINFHFWKVHDLIVAALQRHYDLDINPVTEEVTVETPEGRYAITIKKEERT